MTEQHKFKHMIHRLRETLIIFHRLMANGAFFTQFVLMSGSGQQHQYT
jgi:hypothetical protein